MSGKNLLRRIGTVALSAVMALSVVGAAFAENGRVTYENTYEPQPDLYVYKTVESLSSGYTTPDTEFTFVLKWDQDGDGYMDFAESEKYFLYDSTGTQVWNENSSDGSFRTSTTGRFTLKDGQYVRFEWVGTDTEYEITELTEDGYIQILPENEEPATGTVDAEGTQVYFENMYIPEDGGGDTTQVIIQKDTQWPDGYEKPDFTEDSFTFQIEIDGGAYTNEVYYVYDADDNNYATVIEEGMTDSSGQFTIKGGQRAVFDEVECGVDYVITEVTDGMTGWIQTGTTEYHGSTTAPFIYARFTNQPTWFTIEKERYDGSVSAETEYVFTLTNDTSAMSDVPYYVYDLNGNLVSHEVEVKNNNEDPDVSEEPTVSEEPVESEEPEATAEPEAETETTYVYYTDENGQFTLKAGQTAMFIGLDGTYTVKEETDGSYVIDSIDITGSGDCAVKDEAGDTVEGTASVEGNSIVYTNEQLTDITIEKYNVNKTQLLGGAGFTLYKLNEDYDPTDPESEEWIKVGDEKLTIGYQYQCNECGEVFDTLAEFNAHNESEHGGEAEYKEIEPDGFGTLTFTGLTSGTYKIVETTTPAGYVALGNPIELTIPYALENDVISDDDVDGTDIVWSERDGVYYFYSLTYDVTNEAVLQLPNTGTFPWQWVALGVVLAITAGTTALYVRKTRKESEATEA